MALTRTSSRHVAMLALTVAATLGAPPAAAADTGVILGGWVLEPFVRFGCTYRQNVRIRRGPAPGLYRGTAHVVWDCAGPGSGAQSFDLRVEIDGDRVALRSDHPQWVDEMLTLRSPDRMVGFDKAWKVRLIYERPKAPPTS